MNKSYSEKAMEEIRPHLDYSPGIVKPAQMKGLIDEVVDNTSKEIMGILKHYVSPGLIKQLSEVEDNQLKEKITQIKDAITGDEGRPGSANFIIYSYRKMHQEYHVIKDIKKTNSDLDYSERLRYLFFRFATAVSLAAVILATSYIAHNILCIPLPFSSRLSP